MKWKEGVTVTKNEDTGYHLKQGAKEKAILPQHTYLLEVIQKGMEDDMELIEFIMKKEKMDEVPSSFELAGFLIEYAEFIAEDTSHYDIVG